MSKRVSVIKYETDLVQGEGSYVVLSALKVREIRALRQKGKEAEKAEEAGEDTDDAAFEGGLKILSEHVVDWNWVDDEEKDLPLPKDDPDIIDDLTNDETEFLSDLLTGGKEVKN